MISQEEKQICRDDGRCVYSEQVDAMLRAQPLSPLSVVTFSPIPRMDALVQEREQPGKAGIGGSPMASLL